MIACSGEMGLMQVFVTQFNAISTPFHATSPHFNAVSHHFTLAGDATHAGFRYGYPSTALSSVHQGQTWAGSNATNGVCLTPTGGFERGWAM